VAESRFIVRFNIDDKVLLGKFQGLEKAMRVDVAKAGARAAAEVLVPPLKSGLPAAHGFLRHSITHRVKRYRAGKIVLIVGPRSKSEYVSHGKVHKPSKYAHLVEGGHRKRGRRGRVPGSHRFEAITATRGAAAMRAAVDTIRNQIESLWK
jgi:hypothetical protein